MTVPPGAVGIASTIRGASFTKSVSRFETVLNRYHRDLVLRQMLLKRELKVAVHGQEDIELERRSTEEFAVRNPSPPQIRDGPNAKEGELAGEASIDALIKQNLQAASITAREAPRSSRATTFARDTEGKPSRNASIVSPPSR